MLKSPKEQESDKCGSISDQELSYIKNDVTQDSSLKLEYKGNNSSSSNLSCCIHADNIRDTQISDTSCHFSDFSHSYISGKINF